jgi:hypothetical protein
LKKAALISLLLCVHAAHAVEISGTKVDDRATLAGTELRLNGAGIRKRLIFKVYVGALYLAESRSDAAGVLALEGPKRVSMTLLRDLSAEQMIDALELGIRDNHTQTELAALQSRIDALATVMKEIGSAKKGAVIALDFLPGTGTAVTLDGAARGSAIPGKDFYDALLRIWLGANPVDADLKKAMLGGGG